MSSQHPFELTVTWTGNRGNGTSKYDAYDRSHDIYISGKEVIHASSDPIFRGDAGKPNPEDLFIASISACHMLWYLHICADHGIIVTNYIDQASGILTIGGTDPARITEVILKPTVTITDSSQINLAVELHNVANSKCFIANSLNFKVIHQPQIIIQ
jgi:organic hydroperoxide reductase OsmC/OhrA